VTESGLAPRAGRDARLESRSTIEYLSPVCETVFSDDWYDFADASHFWMQWRLAVTLQMSEAAGVPRNRPLLALDIGGGAGRFPRAGREPDDAGGST